MEPIKWCVVIPAHNEKNRIGNVLKDVKKYTKNIIVVDDGSTDNTSEEVLKENVTLLSHITNMGKGAALKTGCDYAVNKDIHQIIVMDADGQHEPKFIPQFIEKLKTSDLIFGCRIQSENMPFIFRFGNKVIDLVTKLFYGISLEDTQSGFRAFTAQTYKKIRWNSRGYSMESEMIARAGRQKIKYDIIKISTVYGDKYKGTTIIDGIKIVFNLIKWKIGHLD